MRQIEVKDIMLEILVSEEIQEYFSIYLVSTRSKEV